MLPSTGQELNNTTPTKNLIEMHWIQSRGLEHYGDMKII
jgi:hypothetical protein